MQLEKYQAERLKLIKLLLPQFSDKYVLKGGTALSLYYGLNRYSEDIDLDCASQEMDFTGQIKNRGYETWKVTITKNTPTVFRTMINYGATNQLGAYPLKVEVSSRNASHLQKGHYSYQNINGVNVYTIDVLANMKINAFANRTKIRDFYDVGFLLKNYKECFDLTSLQTVQETIDAKGMDNLVAMLKIEQKNHHLGDFDPEIYVLETYDCIEKLWPVLMNKKTLDEKPSILAQIKSFQADIKEKDKEQSMQQAEAHKDAKATELE